MVALTPTVVGNETSQEEDHCQGVLRPNELESKLLQFFYQNIKGLTVEDFDLYIKLIHKKQLDFICLSETWLKSVDRYCSILSYKLLHDK